MANEQFLFGQDEGGCCNKDDKDNKHEGCCDNDKKNKDGGCCSGDKANKDADCDCGCDDVCDCDESEDGECECGSQTDDMNGETSITMTDAEGNEYEFMLYDEIDYKDDSYLLLITSDDEEPELVIVKVVPGEDGNDALMSVDEEEYDRVFAEYERICEEEEEDEDDSTCEEE